VGGGSAPGSGDGVGAGAFGTLPSTAFESPGEVDDSLGPVRAGGSSSSSFWHPGRDTMATAATASQNPERCIATFRS